MKTYDIRLRKLKSRLTKVNKYLKSGLVKNRDFAVKTKKELQEEIKEIGYRRASMANMKIGTRKYHALFGWCKICSPIDTKGMVVVDVELEHLTYEKRVGELREVKRKDDGTNYMGTPASHLFNEKEHVPAKLEMMASVMNRQVISTGIRPEVGSEEWLKEFEKSMDKETA